MKTPSRALVFGLPPCGGALAPVGLGTPPPTRKVARFARIDTPIYYTVYVVLYRLTS